jgi:Cof subfamily protein (haloacid dehalogenase superfamily)
MPNYKLVALDMDGTTYHSMGHVVEENIEPIIKVQASGTKVVFVTGRPLHAPQNRFVENGFTKYESIAIGYNGGLIYDFSKNKKIAENPIPKETLKYAFTEAAHYANDENVLWAYSTDEQTVFLNKDIKGTPLEAETVFYAGKFVKVTPQNLDALNDSYKMLATNCTDDFLANLSANGFEVAYSKQSVTAEINKAGINKKFGVEFLCHKYGITPEEAIAMGDGKNDVPMLEYVGLSIAPSNANPVVKQVVDEVLNLTSTEGAVAHVLNKYILKGN